MTNSKDKPREWKQKEIFDHYVWSDEFIGPFVEKSAYDTLRAELERAKIEATDAIAKYRNIALANTEMTRSDHMSFGFLLLERSRLQAKVKGLVDALNCIASWREGDVVTSSFDNPADAQAAREALAKFSRDV